MSVYFIILLYTLIVFTVILIIVNTHSTSKALAYIMLIFLLPIAGIIIYFSVGINYRKRKLYRKKLMLDQNKYMALETWIKQYYKELFEKETEKIGHFAKLACNNRYDFMISKGNVTELLINGEEKFPRLLQDLRAAKKHIHIEYYIYEEDEIGTEVAEILMQKAKEGVEVRFIYDDFGSQDLSNSFKQKLLDAGVEAVPFYQIKWWLFANGINYRNHRKVVVIDKKTGYIGGINISDKYINTKKNDLYWRDTHIRIEGFAVNSLQYVFLADWNFCAGQNIEFSLDYFGLEETEPVKKDHLVQIVSSGPDSDFPNILYAMIQAILLSKNQVLITTPYFIPDSSFIDAIKIARLSGVKVKILIPGVSDSVFINTVSRSHYEELLEIGVEIYSYKKGFVHAKTMICDNLISFVGTANLDQRSFDLNFEIHSIVYDEEIATKHAGIFENDIKESEEITLEAWTKRPPLQFFIERTARLISPLM